MTDVELVSSVLAGDTNRFERLVSKYMGLARGVCASHVADETAQDDVIQESFIYAFSKLNTLRDARRFGPWLCAIVRNKCTDWHRRNRRVERRERALAAEAANSAAPSPADTLMGEELRDWVRDRIAQLPERTREAMHLCYIEGHSQKESAAFLGISVSALKKRLQYGRDLLGQRILHDFERDAPPKRPDAKVLGGIMLSVRNSPAPNAATAKLPAGSALKIGSFGAVAAALALLFVVFFRSPEQERTVHSVSDLERVAEIDSASRQTESSESAQVELEDASDAVDLEPIAFEIPIAEAKPGGVSGIVIMEDTEEPLEGVEVELLTYADNRGLEPSDSFTTAADGEFAFPDVDPLSEFSLQLGWPYRYGAAPFSRTISGESAPDYFVIKAKPRGAITGYVRYPDGSPAVGVKLNRDFPFGNRVFHLAVTDEDGRYGFAQDGGVWRVKAIGPVGQNSEEAVFELDRNDVVEHDFVFPFSAAIHLTLTSKDGVLPEYVDDVEVHRDTFEPFRNGRNREFTTYTSESIFERDGGRLSLRLIGKGAYTIKLKPEGFRESVVGPIVIDESLADQYAEVELVPLPEDPAGESETERALAAFAPLTDGVDVTFDVVDRNGDALEELGRFIYALDDGGKFYREPGELPPGNYWLAAVKEGYTSGLAYVQVDETSREHTLVLGDGGTIYGKAAIEAGRELMVFPTAVWDILGRPTKRDDIPSETRRLGFALAQGAEPGDDGNFVLPHLPEGSYVVVSNFGASQPVDVRPGHQTGPIILERFNDPAQKTRRGPIKRRRRPILIKLLPALCLPFQSIVVRGEYVVAWWRGFVRSAVIRTSLFGH